MKKLPTLLLLILLTFHLYAQKSEEPVISLTGTAKQSILPDLAIIILVIKIEDADEGKALQKVQETAKSTSTKMQEFGFKQDQIRLTDFSLEAKYIHKKNEGKTKVGYMGQQTIKVKTLINQETISRFLAYISKNKLENTTVHFTTELSKDLEQKTKLQLIEQALKNARLEAELMAKTSNVAIVGIERMGYNEAEPRIRFTPPIVKYDVEEISDENNLESNVTSLLNVEEIEIGEAVSVVYKIKNNL